MTLRELLPTEPKWFKGGQEIPSALIWTKDAVCHFHEDYDGTMCLESLPRNPWGSTPNPVDKE